MGVFFSVYYFMNISGPWLVGHLAEIAGSSRVTFDLGAILLLIAAAVWVVLRGHINGLVAKKQLTVPG
jgi:hypothetical protein